MTCYVGMAWGLLLASDVVVASAGAQLGRGLDAASPEAMSAQAAADGGDTLEFQPKQSGLSYVRANVKDENVRLSFTKFFKGATSKASDFQIETLEEGGYRLSFFSPARTPGYGKLYVADVDNAGTLIREFKDTLDPFGQLVERKWVHGGP